MKLDQPFIERVRRGIEKAIVPAMEKIFRFEGDTFDETHCPGAKLCEKVVDYYDYRPCGISVLAPLALRGNRRARRLIAKIRRNMEHYRTHCYGHDLGDGNGIWMAPLRRLLLHAALAYRTLESVLDAAEKTWWRNLIEEQVTQAIAHNRNFLPGENDLHLHCHNHTAIFMQAIYYCGRIFNRPDWVAQMLDFAERFYRSGHPDGYFEENTNAEREGGPSMLYTPLSAGCLYDVLDGKRHPREKFVRAGNLFRAFLNNDFNCIPLADERSNHDTRYIFGYGLALQSLTPAGRSYIVHLLKSLELDGLSTEDLAVIYHELDLMRTGDCATPEYRSPGEFRLTLPLGIVRQCGFTAGLSALRALNRAYPKNDYALDQQAMVYLAHKKAGVILSGIKSKNDPDYSTFRIGTDAYTVKTGHLELSHGRAEATLFYETFTATARWEISRRPKLALRVDTDRPVVTTLTVTDESFIESKAPFVVVMLKGFSPYTDGNQCGQVKAVRFEWTKELDLAFKVRLPDLGGEYAVIPGK